MSFRPSPLLVCLIATALAVVIARDLATRNTALPIVLACAIGAFVSVHHSLIPFTHRNGAHHRG